MTPFHDYSYYLQVVERNVKQLDSKCLHSDFDVDQNIADINAALIGLAQWVKDVQQKSQG